MGKVRYVCKDCNANKKGGYFSVDSSNLKNVSCPYCGSKNVKRLG
ncbi:MAG: hypothetical protein NDF55_07665 [archaeon GB-1867-005]|nr:hypothetical protein [Candidatus Culexmicrobium cathedralense]